MIGQLQHAAVARDGHGVILGPDCSPADREQVHSDRAGVLRRLRELQQDSFGYYRTLPSTLCREVTAAPCLALDLRATATTRFATASRLHKNSLIGGVPWLNYRAQHPKARLQTRPRPRVLTLYTDELGTRAFDLDLLSEGERRKLFTACMENKVIAGHKLGEVLHWLFAETAARPRYCVDTALLMRQLRSGCLLRPHRWAAIDDAHGVAALDLLDRHRRSSLDIAYVAACAKLQSVNHAYDNAAAWCVSVLSDGHMQFTGEVMNAINDLMRFVGLESPLENAPGQLAKIAPFYSAYQSSMIRLAEAHVRGVPFDRTRAKVMADDLVINPSTETSPVEDASTHYSPQAEDPTENSDGRQDVTADRSGIALAPTQIASRTAMLQNLTDAAEHDGRVHSLVTFSTATGRTSSYQPALQNIPRNEDYRSLLRARPGHSILTVDYCSMELHIAVVLVERALEDVRRRLHDADEDWFLRVLGAGSRSAASTRPLRTSESDPKQHATDEVAWVGRTVLRRQKQCMATVLNLNIDPHLVTGIDLARRAGRLSFQEHPLAYLSRMSTGEQEYLRDHFDRERQIGKAVNFGLLYGMQPAGLHTFGASAYQIEWSLLEATEASAAWFDLYPELRFWQLWTKFCQSEKQPADRFRLPRKRLSSGAYEGRQAEIRVYRTSTLTGRVVTVLNSLPAALSYQGQGTGADILAQAIADLPSDIGGMLLFPVHDELVFEVPTTSALAIKVTVENVMRNAADRVLQTAICAGVENHLGPSWC